MILPGCIDRCVPHTRNPHVSLAPPTASGSTDTVPQVPSNWARMSSMVAVCSTRTRQPLSRESRAQSPRDLCASIWSAPSHVSLEAIRGARSLSLCTPTISPETSGSSIPKLNLKMQDVHRLRVFGVTSRRTLSPRRSTNSRQRTLSPPRLSASQSRILVLQKTPARLRRLTKEPSLTETLSPSLQRLCARLI